VTVQLSGSQYASLVLSYRRIERKQLGDFEYFTRHPERFADEVIGTSTMIDMSEAGFFHGFMPFQIEFMHDFLDPAVPNMFIRCNRGGAKSFLVAYCAVLDIFRHDWLGMKWNIPILAGSDDQALRTYNNYAKKMVLRSPILKKKVKALGHECTFFNSESKLMVLATSNVAVKGERAKLQVIDEICSTPEDVIEDFWGQMITAPAWKCVLSGTPDDPSHISYQWEHDPKFKFKTYHWSAYDCTTDKGGWLTLDTIEQMKLKYRSIYAQRRNILGEWSSYGGSIVGQEFLDEATRDFHITDLPDPNEVEFWIIAGDPARSNHYATIIILGVIGETVYVYKAAGYQNIKEEKLRKLYMKEALVRCHYFGSKAVDRVFMIIEDAPISKALNDNLEMECAKYGISFRKSRFGSDSEKYPAPNVPGVSPSGKMSAGGGTGNPRKKNFKNRFVENMCYYFEQYHIKIPQEFVLLIGQVIAYRWKKQPGKTDDETTGKVQKGNDDFIDALMHGLMRVTQLRRGVGRKMHLAMQDARPENLPGHSISDFVDKKKLKQGHDVGKFLVISRSSNMT